MVRQERSGMLGVGVLSLGLVRIELKFIMLLKGRRFSWYIKLKKDTNGAVRNIQ